MGMLNDIVHISLYFKMSLVVKSGCF